jgi:hypothetical protein
MSYGGACVQQRADVTWCNSTRSTSELALDVAKDEIMPLRHDGIGRAGTSIEALTADALKEEFDYIERIDRLTTIAENRRNDALNEIERRRALFGETLRRSVEEIEDAEFEVIEAPTKGKNAA